jgi:hypothetical protein
MSKESQSDSDTPKRRGRTLTKYSGAKGPGYVSKLSKFGKNPKGRGKRASIRKSIVGRKSFVGGRKSIIYKGRASIRRGSKMLSRLESSNLSMYGPLKSILGNGSPMSRGRKSIVMNHKRKSMIPNPILKNKSSFLAIRGRKKKLSIKP